MHFKRPYSSALLPSGTCRAGQNLPCVLQFVEYILAFSTLSKCISSPFSGFKLSPICPFYQLGYIVVQTMTCFLTTKHSSNLGVIRNRAQSSRRPYPHKHTHTQHTHTHTHKHKHTHTQAHTQTYTQTHIPILIIDIYHEQ